MNALSVFDDGSGGGPALYAGGDFSAADGQSAKNIARWDGASWSPLGSSLDWKVNALSVFDDGSGAGEALYAGGSFSFPGHSVVKWDGQSWAFVPGVMNDDVHALAVLDDGSGAGPALYAGGHFTSYGGLEITSCIARWNGQSWSALSSGMNDRVAAFAVFDDGSCAGPALYAAGWFTSAGGETVASNGLSAGTTGFALPVPNDPGIAGAEVALHGVAVSLLGPGLTLELSNALLVTITR